MAPTTRRSGSPRTNAQATVGVDRIEALEPERPPLTLASRAGTTTSRPRMSKRNEKAPAQPQATAARASGTASVRAGPRICPLSVPRVRAVLCAGRFPAPARESPRRSSPTPRTPTPRGCSARTTRSSSTTSTRRSSWPRESRRPVSAARSRSGRWWSASCTSRGWVGASSQNPVTYRVSGTQSSPRQGAGPADAYSM